MAGRKGTGKGKGRAKALPPKMITVYGEILQETEDAILVRCDSEADGTWLPKSQIKYDGERGDAGVEIEIPDWLANEKGFADGMGFKQEEPPIFPQSDQAPAASPAENERSCETCKHDGEESGHVACEECDTELSGWEARADTEAEADDTPAPKRAMPENVKWIKEDKITISVPLSEAERARYADEMAALDEQIEDLEDERAEVSSRLKKQIDAKEEERRGMSRIIKSGEARTYSCDCLKDYNTGEMVWTEMHPPHNEVQRRKMTPEEMRPSLMEYDQKQAGDSAPADGGQDFDALAEQPAADAPAEAEAEGLCCDSCEHELGNDGSELCHECAESDFCHYTPAAQPEPERTCETCRHSEGNACSGPDECEVPELTGWAPIPPPTAMEVSSAQAEA
jgi:hypothetical protein